MNLEANTYKKRLTMLFIVFFFVFLLSTRFGAASLSFQDIIQVFKQGEVTSNILVFREIRLPRILASILIGTALGLGGSIMQGVSKNPLADPGLLGVTAGASLALTISYALFSALSYIMVILVSFLGSMLGIGLVFLLTMVSRQKMTTITLLLAGSAISTMLFALSQGISIYFRVSKEVSMWTSGGLVGTTWTHIYITLPIIALVIGVAIYYAKEITTLSLDEELAIGLGQNVFRTKILMYTLVALLTGVAVALAGNLAFVGLMIPHMVRGLVGFDYKRIVPVSVLVGGIFLMFSDTLARIIYAPYETPLIAIIAVFGLPFFLYIVRSEKGGVF